MNRLGTASALLLTLALAAIGCTSLGRQPGGQLTLRSAAGSTAALAATFETGYYRYDDQNHVTVLLVDGPADNPAQAVTIRMFWKPRAARTPISTTATNATIHYLIFAGQDNREVGVYSGAGFMFPYAEPGQPTLTAAIWDANLRLTDHTAGFHDLLGNAALSGRFTVTRDDVAVEQALHQLRIQLRNRLGYPRLVSDSAQRRAAILHP